MSWKISPAPFPLGENLAKEIESLGRVLLQFYRAVNLLYRKSAEGKQPEWVARWRMVLAFEPVSSMVRFPPVSTQRKMSRPCIDA